MCDHSSALGLFDRLSIPPEVRRKAQPLEFHVPFLSPGHENKIAGLTYVTSV